MSADSLGLLLKAFCLPTMAEIYERVVQEAEQQGWGYRQFLQHLCEAEAQDRAERKLERLLKQSGLPRGKTLGSLEEAKLPAKVRRVWPSLLDGGFVLRAENVIALGLPGRGKSHFLAAPGQELILRHKYAVLFTPTFKLVQQLLTAKRELRLEGLLRKLDQFDAVILDDLGYVKQDREEMEVLFTFLAERYERRSVLLSSNLVFSKWDQIFKDPMTTMAAIDRLVHHAIILEFNGESMRVPRDPENEKGGSSPGTPTSPFGSATSLAPGGAKDFAPPKGLAQRVRDRQQDDETVNKLNRPHW